MTATIRRRIATLARRTGFSMKGAVAPVTQTEFREPVPVTHPIQTRVLAGADQLTCRLQLGLGT